MHFSLEQRANIQEFIFDISDRESRKKIAKKVTAFVREGISEEEIRKRLQKTLKEDMQLGRVRDVGAALLYIQYPLDEIVFSLTEVIRIAEARTQQVIGQFPQTPDSLLPTITKGELDLLSLRRERLQAILHPSSEKHTPQ